MESSFKNLEISLKNGDGDDDVEDLPLSPTSSCTLSIDGPYQSLLVSPSKSDIDEQFQMPILRNEMNVIILPPFAPVPVPASTPAITLKSISKPSSIRFNQEQEQHESKNDETNVFRKKVKRDLSPDICYFRKKFQRTPTKKDQNIAVTTQEKEEEMDDNQSIIVPIVNIIDEQIAKQYSLTSAPCTVQNRILSSSGVIINSISPSKQSDTKSQETLLIEHTNIDAEMRAITLNEDSKSEKPIDKQMKIIEDESKSKAKLVNEKENIIDLNSSGNVEVEVDKNSQDQPTLLTKTLEENENSSKPADPVSSYSSSRPKRVVTARKRFGIEYQVDEPYRRRKKDSINPNEPMPSTSSASQSFFAGLLNTTNKSKSIRKGKSQNAISQIKANVTDMTDESQGSADESTHSSTLVSFATTYSEEDQEILYKVGKFVINKRDAFFDPYSLDRESEDLDIYQIEENKIRLFEGLFIEKVLFHVSTEETILVSKEGLYRDYQPIYVDVILIKTAADTTKPPHIYAKYFVVDRISPVLAVISHSFGFYSTFANCLKIITTQVVSDGYLKLKLTRNSQYFNEEIYTIWMTLNEAKQIHVGTLLGLLPWNKDLFKLLDKYPYIRKYEKDDKEVLPTTICHFCSLNKYQRSYHDIFGFGYDNLDFSLHNQEVIDPVCICSNCETSVYIYSRIYHHLFHVYRTMNSNVDTILDKADEHAVIRATNLVDYFVNNKYFVKAMFLDFQVILAECERLIDSLQKIKEAEKIQQNEDNQAMIHQLIEMDKSIETSIPPGPLSVKIKNLKEKIVQTQPTVSTSTTEPFTSETNLVNMQSTSSTT